MYIEGGEPMASDWIHQLLQAHLSEDDYQKLKPQIDSEAWASPAARHRMWSSASEEHLPLRYHLDIDIRM